MLNPYLEWTDAVGLARITSLVPVLNGWLPDIEPVGPAAVTLGGGVTYRWPFRTDYCVKFTLAYIPASQAAELLRLKNWLLNGGTITVATGDLGARVYTCRLRPETTIDIAQDPANLEYAVTLELINTVAAPLVALWQGAGLLFGPSTDYAALGGTFTRATVAAYMTGP